MDIRWEQRFSNYTKALDKLDASVLYIQNREEKDQTAEELLKEGLIQRFEYTHELAWNVMKDYAVFQGNTNIGGSRDATREAFKLQLLSDGQLWMDMIASRNKTSHTYNQETADEIFSKIINAYHPAFIQFKKVMQGKLDAEQEQLI